MPTPEFVLELRKKIGHDLLWLNGVTGCVLDDRGRLLNIAFLTSAGCALGDHLAYTNQIAPELCAPVMVGKLVGGISALAAALLLAKRLPLSAGTGQQAERGSAADELMI